MMPEYVLTDSLIPFFCDVSVQNLSPGRMTDRNETNEPTHDSRLTTHDYNARRDQRADTPSHWHVVTTAFIVIFDHSLHC